MCAVRVLVLRRELKNRQLKHATRIRTSRHLVGALQRRVMRALRIVQRVKMRPPETGARKHMMRRQHVSHRIFVTITPTCASRAATSSRQWSEASSKNDVRTRPPHCTEQTAG